MPCQFAAVIDSTESLQLFNQIARLALTQKLGCRNTVSYHAYFIIGEVWIFKVVPLTIGFAMNNESISLQRIEVIIDRLAIRLMIAQVLCELFLDF